MKKKISIALAAFAFALLLVVGSVAGTFAYLTSTAEVTNTFTVGNVAITMTETKVDLYGDAVPNANRVTENEYKLIPGRTYTKDPTIYVDAASEDCYVFFKLENGLGDDAEIIISDTDWAQIGTTNVYYYKAVANAGDDCVAFSTFTVADDAVVANYATAKIVVTAYAVQVDGFDNAEAAWAATFGATNP